MRSRSATQWCVGASSGPGRVTSSPAENQLSLGIKMNFFGLSLAWRTSAPIDSGQVWYMALRIYGLIGHIWGFPVEKEKQKNC